MSDRNDSLIRGAAAEPSSSQGPSLRRPLLAALALPRRVMQTQVSLELCPHAGYYADWDAVCATCDSEIECTWLAAHDEQAGLEQKSLGALVEGLETAHAYMDARITRLGHNRSRCRCEACQWLRDADRLLGLARD